MRIAVLRKQLHQKSYFAIYGAGEFYSYPCLVIDGGTALTFTGVDEEKTLVGGSILPRLRSQFKLLNQQTAQLPQVETLSSLPRRWAIDTPNAIVLIPILGKQGLADFGFLGHIFNKGQPLVK